MRLVKRAESKLDAVLDQRAKAMTELRVTQQSRRISLSLPALSAAILTARDAGVAMEAIGEAEERLEETTAAREGAASRVVAACEPAASQLDVDELRAAIDEARE